MKHYLKHIAWLFILIFTIFGLEKINFSSEPICSKDLKFCPIANMYVYNVFNLSTDSTSEKTADKNSSTITTISCETFFINQNELIVFTKTEVLRNFSDFYYKPVIHSTPYIPLTDPPPII